MYEESNLDRKENDAMSSVSTKSKGTVAKPSESVKSIAGSAEPQLPVKFTKSSFKNETSIVGSGLVEIDVEDVIYYHENITEYKKESNEKLIPYIVRLSESFKKDAIYRQRSKKYKRGAKFIFGLLFILLILGGAYLVFSWFTSSKS